MKKLKIFLILLSFFTISSVNAQITYTHTVDSLFSHLSKTPITTGILYDRAYPLAAVHLINKKEADTAYNEYFIEAYREIFTSAYSQTGWLNPDTLINYANKASGLRTVPVGLSFYTYNVIDTNAIANNLIQMHSDSLYYDTPNRTTSPYNTLNTFVASPLLDSIRADSAVVFYFPSNLFMNKSSFTLTSLNVDFNDGKGLIAITLGSSYKVTYTSPNGYRYLKFSLKMSNGVTYNTYGKIKIYNIGAVPGAKVAKAQTTPQICSLIPLDYPITGYKPFKDYNGFTATGNATLEMNYATNGSCDYQFHNPILIVDTYDPQFATYNPYYNPLNGALYSQFNQNYSASPGMGYLDYLRSQGYDIATLVFNQINSDNQVIPGGEDYVERNAQTVIAAINWLNNNKAKTGSSKLIVIGPSTGGLTTQYALRYMEQNNLPHGVKLWVTIDAPFLGANVPLGLQEFIDYIDPLKAQALVGNPAAKELLLTQYSNSFDHNTSAQAFRNQFVTTMNSMGFPVGDPGQPFRKIAITDGSLGGNEFNTPCEEGFSFASSHTFTIHLFLFKVRIKVNGASAQMYFTPTTGSSCTVLKASELLTSGETISTTTSSLSSSVDVAPGGVYDFIAQTQQQGTGIVTWVGGFIPFVTSFSNVIGNSSFVSTKSALAFTGSNKKYNENVSTRNLVCTNETPFNSYFGSFTNNQYHVALWDDAMNWLTQEINGNPQPPSVMATSNAYSISGPATACTSGVYSVANVPNTAVVTWSATPSSAVTLTPSGQSVTVTELYASDVTLNASVNYNCQTANSTPLNIHVGAPSTPVITGFLKNFGSSFNMIFGSNATGVSYHWVINGVSQSSTSSSCTYPAPSCSGGLMQETFTIQLTVTNSCGSTTACQQFLFTCNNSVENLVSNGICGGGGGVQVDQTGTSDIVFYPNPSNQTLIVSSKSNTANIITASSVPFAYKLFNQKGKVLFSGQSNGDNIVLDVSRLPNDLYILHVIINKKTVEKKVIVQH